MSGRVMSGRLGLITAMTLAAAAPANVVDSPSPKKAPSKATPRRRRMLGGARIAVMTRQLKRAQVRDQAMKLAEDRGLTRRQAKRNRLRNKIESRHERRDGGRP